jgi:RNA polymerase sigma-70 factor (ECF subfamily)
MSEEILVLAERAARGDAEARELLLERHLDDLRAFVRLRAGALVRAQESHSDLVQSVCREVLEHADQFRFPSEDGFRRWLFTTALRKLTERRDHYLAQKRDVLRQVPLAPPDDHGEHGGAYDEERLLDCYRNFATPSQHAIVREELARIESAFEQLTEEHREVITLAKVAGLSRAEIAVQMNRSEGAVRMLLVRALAELAAQLNP